MLALKSRMAFNSKFYGDVDEYEKLANELVMGLKTLETFEECVDYFSTKRSEIAFKSKSLDSEFFRERKSEMVYTNMARIHRFIASLIYIQNHQTDFKITQNNYPEEENPCQKIIFKSKDPKENIFYVLKYIDVLTTDKISDLSANRFFEEISPSCIIVEDYGTEDRIKEHSNRFKKVVSFETLTEFIYYLARNVVHLRGGGSFAEYMALSLMLKMEYSVEGLKPSSELWALAVSSSLKEFQNNFLNNFIMK